MTHCRVGPWDIHSDQWEEGFSYLKHFADREGHCRVPYGYKTDDGFRLGQWVRNQRSSKDTMEPVRRQRLETLPGWSWDVLSDQWEEGFSHLKQFSEREGHCRVATLYKTEEGYRLGGWVVKQRSTRDLMEPDRRQQLESLPGWSWRPYSDQWERSFAYLKEFAERDGHCQVPKSYKTDDGFKLGQWVSVQRRDQDKMKSDRRHRLEVLPGWSWDVLSDQWKENVSPI